MPRTYYRCSECLAAFTTETPIPHAPVGGLQAVCECGGKVGRMGVVCGTAFGHEAAVCKCDARCTHAMGPNCDCVCRGANHGSGMAGTTVCFRPDGKAVIRVSDEKAKLRAAEFRTLYKLVEDAVAARKGRADTGYFRGQPLLYKAKRAASHHARMKSLRGWLTQYAPEISVPESLTFNLKTVAQ